MRILVACVATLLFASHAEAGRRAFMFTWDTETVNAGDVELEQWLWARGLQENRTTAAWLWFSPIYGLHDRVELAFPWEAVATVGGTRITNFTAEGRFRLYDPNDGNRFVRNLIRVAYQQNFVHPDNAGLPDFTPWAHLNIVTSLGDVKGSHATIDVGGQIALSFGTNKVIKQTVGVGYTQRITDELRLSAEYFHELVFGGAPITLRPNGDPAHHFFVGPGIAYSRGRFWMTLGCLIGLTPATPRVQPRLLIGIAI